MLKNNNCNLKNQVRELNVKGSVCLQLYVVDEAKTDFEYNCSKCKDI